MNLTFQSTVLEFPAEQREQLLWHCQKSWNIPLHIRDHLDRYYVLHWETKYFLQNAQMEFIDHQGIPYSVAYYGVLPPTIHKYEKILLSFRKPANAERGIVLIRPELGTEIMRKYP
jgi:hypothetical protein